MGRSRKGKVVDSSGKREMGREEGKGYLISQLPRQNRRRIFKSIHNLPDEIFIRIDDLGVSEELRLGLAGAEEVVDVGLHATVVFPFAM